MYVHAIDLHLALASYDVMGGGGGGRGVEVQEALYYRTNQSINQIHKESNFKKCASADKLSTAALPCYVCCAQ